MPLFLRIVREAALNSNGLKQDKVQPRLEGVDPARVRGDSLYFLKDGRYHEFTKEDWNNLSMTRAKL